MKPIIVLGAAALAMSGCAAETPTDAGRTTVVATTTIWGSITDQVVGCAGDGQTLTLMPVGADPHDFSASSSDVSTMIDAELVVANGLGLEEGLTSALESASSDGAQVLEVAPALAPIPLAEHQGADHAADEHPGGEDPHVWQDMGRASTGALLIGQRLTEITGDGGFASCGQQVADDILATQDQLAQILSAVPADQRIMVTDHDALTYFATAYEFQIAGVVIPGGSTLSAASSAQVAELARTIEDTGVPAIFSNTATSAAVMDALAAEAGGVAVVPLYIDSVGEPGTDAATYQGMMLANAKAIANALA